MDWFLALLIGVFYFLIGLVFGWFLHVSRRKARDKKWLECLNKQRMAATNMRVLFEDKLRGAAVSEKEIPDGLYPLSQISIRFGNLILAYVSMDFRDEKYGVVVEMPSKDHVMSLDKPSATAMAYPVKDAANIADGIVTVLGKSLQYGPKIVEKVPEHFIGREI